MCFFSASSLDRVMVCPASTTLPQIDVPTMWRERGRWIHKYRELRDTVSETLALAQIPPEFREACRHLVLDALPPGAEHEVAYAYDVDTGTARRLEGCTDRNYEVFDLGPFEIPGTLDVQYMDGDTIVVPDYKTAYGKRVLPATSPTMMLYGLCAWKVSGARKCRLIYRNTDIGRDFVSEVDFFQFLEFEDSLRHAQKWIAAARAAAAARKVPVVTQGDHCRYCPAQEHCPAKNALAERVRTGEMARRVGSLIVDLDDDDQFRRLFQFYRKLDGMTKRIKDALRARVLERPGPTRHGYEYAARQTRGKETLDGDTVHRVVTEMYGPEVADKVVVRSATKRGLKQLKDVVPRGGYAEVERNVLKAVRELGGATRSVGRMKIDEYPIQALEVANG